jgi:hypothetical protein
LDLSFAITHMTEPSSQRHHRLWLARVSEGGLDHYVHALHQRKLLVVG